MTSQHRGRQSDHDAGTAPAEAETEAAQDTATDPHELDFSRLRRARASLDNAFPAQ